MKASTTCAIGMVLAAAYFGGKSTNTGVAQYEYAEVYDAVGSCGPGTFTGQCSDCTECLPYEYNAGGCSYFKDTLCVLCEDIPHCGETESLSTGKMVPAITCTDSFDHVCGLCEPGYWDEDCKPCKVCDSGSYETQKCTQESNTVCAPCTTCEDTEFLSTACTYFTDSICTACTICIPGDFSSVECQMMDTVYTETADTVCSGCAEPTEGASWVTDACTITKDTKIAPCSTCVDREEYIGTACNAGSWSTPGDDIDCTKCTPRPNAKYTVWHCDADGFKDSLHTSCSVCSKGEYQFAECTESSDTLCPDCKAIDHCKEGALKCMDEERQTIDSICEDCTEGYFGDTCAYEKTFSACGTITTRERRASQYGYDGNSNEEFISFCLEMCDEFPDCMAFEVVDGASFDDNSWDAFFESGSNSLSDRGATCEFKSAYSRLTFQVERDCYSNIVRQGDKFRDPSGYDDMTEWMLWYQADVLQYRHGWGKYAENRIHPAHPPVPPTCDPSPVCQADEIGVGMDEHGCGGTCEKKQ